MLSGVGGSQRVDGLEAPLTGRDAELRTIRELFHAAVDRRVPRLVLVSGPAGVGKSRLGWEFFKYIDGLAQLVRWHRGRCLSYGEGVSFWALAEIVRQRLGIAEEDPADAAAAKLAAGLDRLFPDDGERMYAGARLGRLLGVALDGDDGAVLAREELFAGWRLFFERLAAEQPVVLLIEDAQYANAGLLDFLDHLVDWTRDLPVFVLVLARPELGQARPGFGAGRNRSTLTLDPLDAASMEAAGGRAGARDARPGAREDHRPGAGYPAVRGGDHPVAGRPGRRPARRGGLPAGGQSRPAGRAGQPARAAGRPAGCPGPGRAAAGR